MAKELSPLAAAAAEEKAKLKQEKQQFKQEQKTQKKEAKRRAAEIAKQEEALGEDDGNGVVTFLATVLIVVLWLAIVCVVIKLDIGGFGSSVMAPILKDVPVISMILPSASPAVSDEEQEGYGGYASIEDAVAYIRQLELELEREQTASKAKDTENEALRAEVLRLKEFEQKQSEFQRIVTEFYEEVVYSDKGPGLEEYMKYYEAMDPTTAEYLYKQGLVQQQKNEKVEEYIQTFAAMKPKQVAEAFKNMEDNLSLVVEILNAMSVEERAAIMNVMDSELVAKVAKMMHPDS